MSPTSRQWLARLSYSFLIVAGVLMWELYEIHQGRRGSVPQWRIALYSFAAVAGFVLGVLGIRERHRPRDDEEQEKRET